MHWHIINKKIIPLFLHRDQFSVFCYWKGQITNSHGPHCSSSLTLTYLHLCHSFFSKSTYHASLVKAFEVRTYVRIILGQCENRFRFRSRRRRQYLCILCDISLLQQLLQQQRRPPQVKKNHGPWAIHLLPKENWSKMPSRCPCPSDREVSIPLLKNAANLPWAMPHWMTVIPTDPFKRRALTEGKLLLKRCIQKIHKCRIHLQQKLDYIGIALVSNWRAYYPKNVMVAILCMGWKWHCACALL